VLKAFLRQNKGAWRPAAMPKAQGSRSAQKGRVP
jgi:hypothetical protein